MWMPSAEFLALKDKQDLTLMEEDETHFHFLPFFFTRFLMCGVKLNELSMMKPECTVFPAQFLLH